MTAGIALDLRLQVSLGVVTSSVRLYIHALSVSFVLRQNLSGSTLFNDLQQYFKFLFQETRVF